jgi:hypothetical protein
MFLLAERFILFHRRQFRLAIGGAYHPAPDYLNGTSPTGSRVG